MRASAGGFQTRTTVVHRTRAAGSPNRNVSVDLLGFTTDFQDVPGLGFDFPHLAAVSRHAADAAAGSAERFPFGFGGFLAVVARNPRGRTRRPVRRSSAGRAGGDGAKCGRKRTAAPSSERQFLSRTSPRAGPSGGPVRNMFSCGATAACCLPWRYSWDNGTLRYVTRDGLRQSVTQDALDMDATQQFNEQRGLSFRVPA